MCGPDQETCVANQTLTYEECLVSCEGLYADITDDSLKQYVEQNTMKGFYCDCICNIFSIKIRIPNNCTRVEPRHLSSASCRS